MDSGLPGIGPLLSVAAQRILSPCEGTLLILRNEDEPIFTGPAAVKNRASSG